jgi:hypothetical protein
MNGILLRGRLHPPIGLLSLGLRMLIVVVWFRAVSYTATSPVPSPVRFRVHHQSQNKDIRLSDQGRSESWLGTELRKSMTFGYYSAKFIGKKINLMLAEELEIDRTRS